MAEASCKGLFVLPRTKAEHSTLDVGAAQSQWGIHQHGIHDRSSPHCSMSWELIRASMSLPAGRFARLDSKSYAPLVATRRRGFCILGLLKPQIRDLQGQEPSSLRFLDLNWPWWQIMVVRSVVFVVLYILTISQSFSLNAKYQHEDHRHYPRCCRHCRCFRPCSTEPCCHQPWRQGFL
jgi:hypothetical protein